MRVAAARRGNLDRRMVLFDRDLRIDVPLLDLLLPWVVPALEARVLFQPSKPLHYSMLPEGQWMPLPSGGGLYEWTFGVRPPFDGDTRRSVLFLHGNSGSLDDIVRPLEPLVRLGYRVFAVEYPEFVPLRLQRPALTPSLSHPGMTFFKACGKPGRFYQMRRPQLSLDSVWAAGAAGMMEGEWTSHGGDRRSRPAQLVLLNTFVDLPRLVEDVAGLSGQLVGSFITPWMDANGNGPAPAASQDVTPPRSHTYHSASHPRGPDCCNRR